MNHFFNRNFRLRASRFVVVAMTLLCIAAIFVPALTAQTASAGAVIGNQATATYNDAQGVSRQAFSNLVQTTVAQVFSGTLNSSQSRFATIGTQVVFPHTYTNNGNGSDTVTIAFGTGANGTTAPSAGFGSPFVYIDANGDGVPDNTTNINGTSFTLAANQVLKFVVVGTLSTTANATETAKIYATSGGAGTVSGNPNTDTITRTTGAAIAVTKSMSASSGVGGDLVGVTLTYTNTGNATATSVVIVDPLGSTGTQASSNTFVYKANSGMLNGTALTDSTTAVSAWYVQGSSAGAGGNILTLNLPSGVAPGVTGTVTFNVTVGALATIGGTVNNTANFAYNDSLNPIAVANTNTVPFTIQQSAGLAWTAADNFVAGTPPTDILTQSVNQGGTVTWTDTVKNNGNGYDTFNITYNTSTFPLGTTFQFFRADGLTPLTDTNGDGIIDVGPVKAGLTAQIYVKAILPAVTVAGATWTVNIIATSTMSPTVLTATIQDGIIATLKTSTVDLTITASANTGAEPGKGPGFASGFSSSVNPGAQVIFPFYVQNTSMQATNADSYSLLVQTAAAAGNITTPAGLVPNSSVVPVGWTAVFHSGNCAGSPITSTPALTAANGANTAGSWQLVCLELDVPAGYVGGTQSFIVQALSSSTGAIDQMAFTVTVNTTHLVGITPNQSGQVYAGGTVTYKHQITNGGNSAESVVFPAGTTVVFNPALSGWTATVYQDNGTTGTAGVLDSGDAVVVPGATSIPLAIGQSIAVFVKIQASPSANPGDSTVSTLKITYATSSSSAADDTTTVIAGQIKLVKSQWIDAPCTHLSPTFTTAIGSVASGQCIIYQIQATNSGTTNVTGVTFADAAPAFTKYLTDYPTTSANDCSLGGGTLLPVPSGTTPFTAAFTGSMTPSCTATITFEVKLN